MYVKSAILAGYTHINSMSTSPTLLRQVVGALIGGTLGLIAYYGYELGAPHVSAWITIPQKELASNGEGAALADAHPSDRKEEHLRSRAKEIAEKFGAAYKTYKVEESTAAEISPDEPEEIDTTAASEDLSPEATVDAQGVALSDTEAVAESTSVVDHEDASSRSSSVAIAWDDAHLEKELGPQTDALPNSGIGILGAAFVAGASTLGMKFKRKK